MVEAGGQALGHLSFSQLARLRWLEYNRFRRSPFQLARREHDLA